MATPDNKKDYNPGESTKFYKKFFIVEILFVFITILNNHRAGATARA